MEERRKGYEEIIAHMAATNVKLEAIHQDLGELRDKVKTQNGRIGKLENWRWFVMGGFALFFFVIELFKK